MKITQAVALVTLAALPFTSYSATLSELESRIESLESELEIAHEAVDENSRVLEHQTRISGYVDVEYKDFSKSSNKPGFRMHHANLMILKKFNEKWNFFSELELEDGPFVEAEDFEATSPTVDSGTIEANGAIMIEKVGLDYKWTPTVNVRMGRFVTPAGIWNEDHYTPFTATQELPMHIRKIFPLAMDGIGIYGTIPIANVFMDYSLHTGNGEGNTGSGDGNSDKALGLRASFVFPKFQHLEAGFTYHTDTLNDGSDKTDQGVHFKFREGPWAVQAEYATGETDTGASVTETTGYYIQPAYNYDKWTFGVRYDVWDNDSGASTLTEKTANSLFVNYRVMHNIVLKAEHHMYGYEDPATAEDTMTILSAAVFLGD